MVESGIHKGLKIPRLISHAGSNPASGTKKEMNMKSDLSTETRLKIGNELHILTVCDNCNELLRHKILINNKSYLEIRIEPCNECSNIEKGEQNEK